MLNRPLLNQTGRVLCKAENTDGNGELQETTQHAQSEKSLRLLQQLYAGEVDTIYSMWRGQHGDGRLWEKGVHAWVTEWEEHADGTRTPLYMAGVAHTSKLVCME